MQYPFEFKINTEFTQGLLNLLNLGVVLKLIYFLQSQIRSSKKGEPVLST